ncbi:hypothetical protein AB6A40_005835 [Gnathostoma spinigerum]|uniref:Uncharacterized protein n=1 Tax=Gnathostoma spinigerum TaxID=75299 RepID=A0ABD6EIP2_9BILA
MSWGLKKEKDKEEERWRNEEEWPLSAQGRHAHQPLAVISWSADMALGGEHRGSHVEPSARPSDPPHAHLHAYIPSGHYRSEDSDSFDYASTHTRICTTSEVRLTVCKVSY